MTTTREAALPLADAPKDHTMVWLLVDYSGDGANPLEDEILGWTIGHNGFDHTGVDEWEFAGWSWEQDCFTQGVGNVVGWYPLQRPDQQPATPATEPQGYHGVSVRADTVTRPAPQPAADTRVVDQEWMPIETAPRDGTWFRAKTMGSPGFEQIRLVHFADKYDRLPVNGEDVMWTRLPAHWQPLSASAIIGTATPAPSDKIAEAARECRPETYASGVQCRTCGQSWGEDGPEQCPNAALAGQGETP